jgi:hypothetical protein
LPRRAEAGERTLIRWATANAQRVVLRTVDPSGVVVDQPVQAVGSRTVRFQIKGRHQVVILATPRAFRGRRPGNQQAVERGLLIEVTPRKPSVMMVTASSVAFGVPLPVRWTIEEARAAQLLIDGEARPDELEGHVVLPNLTCGIHHITLVAQGEGGRSERVHAVSVIAPQVVISVVAEHEVEFGDNAVVPYAIVGARSATIDAMDWRVPLQDVPLVGTFEVEALLELERFRITAVGHDGRKVMKTISVRARLFNQPSIASELDFLRNPFADALKFIQEWRP